MLFNSLEFLVFFAVVFPLYCALSRRWQNHLLLLASYIFYGWAEPKFVVLMALTTIVDFWIGMRIEDASTPRNSKRWLVASIILNLSLLGTFKYLGFATENINALAQALGWTSQFNILSIAVPAGISFYTFHEISYVTDVYRKHIKAARKFEDFAVFISFFPQLVAGPIGRASWQMPQFQNPRRMSYEGWSEGLTLFVIGMFRKIVVADPLGMLAKTVFDNPERCGRWTLLIGLYCFAFQIYADFAGYSDMARGLARFLGFNLIQNFEHPYFSTNITEFWRRWHISLSSWLRDYLYIPLGGNRLGTLRTYVNLFLTMFLGGLWHGASWNYAVWGMLHGIFLAVHKWMMSRNPNDSSQGKEQGTAPWHPMNTVKAIATFHLVALTWIFFASKSFETSGMYLRGLFGKHMASATGRPPLNKDDLTAAGVGLLIMLLLVDLPQYLKQDHCAMLRWKFGWRVLGFLVLVLAALFTRGAEHVPFIYFKF
ncbi:MAG: MBOAT family protein [Planctomycetota bacterium]